MDTSMIGRKSPKKTIGVEKGQLKLFALATQQADSIYSDEDAAKAAGHKSLPVPPTFLMCLHAIASPEGPDLLPELGIDLGRVLHGEQRFKYLKTAYAGDVITFQSELIDMYEKKGGALQFVVQEMTATNQDDEVVAKIIFSFVVR